MSPNHYATLGVADHSDDVVIRAAYKALMLKYHPDTNKNADATRRAADINAAFTVLGDPQQRAAYDATRGVGRTAPPSPPAPPPTPPGHEPSPRPSAPAPVEAGRWAQLGAWLGGVLIIAIIRVAVSAASHSHSTPVNAASMETTTVADMNSMDGLATMSANMVAVDAAANGGMMANMADAIAVPAAKLGEAVPVNFDDVEGAAQQFAKVLDTGGMIGARAWSQKCHKAVDAAPTWPAADRCAAFDYAARYLDVGYSQAAGTEPIGYFAFATDNQADQYTRIGAPAYSLIDRLARIQKAAEPATNEAVSAVTARRKAKRTGNQQDIERAVGPSFGIDDASVSNIGKGDGS